MDISKNEIGTSDYVLLRNDRLQNIASVAMKEYFLLEK